MITLSMLLLACTLSGAGSEEPEHRDHVVPAEFSGWVFVEYGVSAAAPLPVQSGREQAMVPATGWLQTGDAFRMAVVDHRFRTSTGRNLPVLASSGVQPADEPTTTRPVSFVCCQSTLEHIDSVGTKRTFDTFYVGRGPAGARPPPPR